MKCLNQLSNFLYFCDFCRKCLKFLEELEWNRYVFVGNCGIMIKKSGREYHVYKYK